MYQPSRGCGFIGKEQQERPFHTSARTAQHSHQIELPGRTTEHSCPYRTLSRAATIQQKQQPEAWSPSDRNNNKKPTMRVNWRATENACDAITEVSRKSSKGGGTENKATIIWRGSEEESQLPRVQRASRRTKGAAPHSTTRQRTDYIRYNTTREEVIRLKTIEAVHTICVQGCDESAGLSHGTASISTQMVGQTARENKQASAVLTSNLSNSTH